YDRSLFCDRAVIGGWDRTTEPILPYTTAETMDAGWSWQIEHEHHINRGYVYSSQAISDDEATSEFLSKNPKAPKSPRVVKFRSGRYRRQWVENVVAIGNSGGFVEPLEATALMVVCAECQTLVDLLQHCALKPTETMRRLFNRQLDHTWDDIRDFLALHYYVNTRLDTPFWKHCREDTDVSHISELLEFYHENGPTGFARYTLQSPENNFGIEGYLVMLVANRVPYLAKHQPTPVEQQAWNAHRAGFITEALSGIDVKEALAYIRHPAWQWNAEVAPPSVPVVGTPMR
ncbi:MAG TPA: tryptophan 7-halogenase, partial [Chthoniobacteraceae bacterium]|nr:tryptophan 7-halogenase [Chthoniobacteraceae bacterium]